MGMTMTQKILAAHAGLDSVTAGQLIEAKLDVVMANDITGPMALPIFRQMADKVFDKDKVVLVPDHFTPNKDIKSAENSKSIREFAKNQGLSWYFEQGKSGVEHAILPEAGVVAAGECILAQIPIPVHMVRWVHSQQVSEQPILQQVWQWENCGSKFQVRSSSY